MDIHGGSFLSIPSYGVVLRRHTCYLCSAAKWSSPYSMLYVQKVLLLV
jgi:hypothetical protein